jgi:hypothetical protein
MEPSRWLLVWGTLLLTGSALLGFVQHRYRDQPEAFSRWRVVHVGGTAGAVQLLALSAVWGQVGVAEPWGRGLVAGLIFSTCAFFLGPLAHALGWPRAARTINRAGGLVGLPAYLALPALLFLA